MLISSRSSDAERGLVLDSAGDGGAVGDGLGDLLSASADAAVVGEAERIEATEDIDLVLQAVGGFAEQSDAGLLPRRGVAGRSRGVLDLPMPLALRPPRQQGESFGWTVAELAGRLRAVVLAGRVQDPVAVRGLSGDSRGDTTCFIQRATFVLAVVGLLSGCGGDEGTGESDAGASDLGIGDGRDSGGEDAAADSGGEDAVADSGGEDAPAGSWGAVCTTDGECEAPTDYCVIQPGAPEGYCTLRCEGFAACADAPETWTCNTLSFTGCEDFDTNWCGPNSELETFSGIVIACE